MSRLMVNRKGMKYARKKLRRIRKIINLEKRNEQRVPQLRSTS